MRKIIYLSDQTESFAYCFADTSFILQPLEQAVILINDGSSFEPRYSCCEFLMDHTSTKLKQIIRNTSKTKLIQMDQRSSLQQLLNHPQIKSIWLKIPAFNFNCWTQIYKENMNSQQNNSKNNDDNDDDDNDDSYDLFFENLT
jgi:hypothetical protein